MEIDRRLLEAAGRHQLIAPLLDPSLSRNEKSGIRNEILSGPVYHLEKGKVKLSKRTLRRWRQMYREKGIEGLLPAKTGNLSIGVKLKFEGKSYRLKEASARLSQN